MKNCEQTKGQSVLDHGLSVKNYTFDLINHLRKGTPLKYEWIIPDWLYENKDLILSNLPSDRTLKYYSVVLIQPLSRSNGNQLTKEVNKLLKQSKNKK